jgi:hypothetical protein
MNDPDDTGHLPNASFDRVSPGPTSRSEVIAVRRRSALGLVVAAAGFALLVLPSLYPLHGAVRGALMSVCVLLGFVLNISALLRAKRGEGLLAGIGLALGALSLVWIIAVIYDVGGFL